MADFLTTPAEEVPPVVPPSTEELSPVVESTAHGIEAEVVSIVAVDKIVGGKSHTVDSRLSPDKSHVEVVARKKKSIRRDETNVVDALTDVDADIVVAVAVCEGSIAKDRRNIGLDTNVAVLALSRSSQVTVEIEVIGQGNVGVVKKPSVANVIGKHVNLVPNKATQNAARSCASSVLISGVEDGDLFALRPHIQELQTEHANMVPLRARNQKSQMDTLLKLCHEKEKSDVLKPQMKRSTQQPADVRVAQKTVSSKDKLESEP